MTDLDADLIRYLTARDQQHARQVERTLNAMTEREQLLVREAAVMSYVRGNMAGKCQDFKIPKDTAILYEVIDACLAFDDLYPTVSSLRAGREEDDD